MASAKHTIEWVRNEHGNPPVIRQFPEGASETFKRGNPVIYDDSEDGIVAITVSSGVPSAQTMLGLALEDASGTTGTFLDVLIPTDGDIFSASLLSDQDTLVAPAQDGVYGELFGIIKMSTTAGAGTEWGVDNGNTNWVSVIDYDYRDVAARGGTSKLAANMSAGDRVLFRFLGTIIDSTGRQA